MLENRIHQRQSFQLLDSRPVWCIQLQMRDKVFHTLFQSNLDRSSKICRTFPLSSHIRKGTGLTESFSSSQHHAPRGMRISKEHGFSAAWKALFLNSSNSARFDRRSSGRPRLNLGLSIIYSQSHWPWYLYGCHRAKLQVLYLIKKKIR